MLSMCCQQSLFAVLLFLDTVAVLLLLWGLYQYLGLLRSLRNVGDLVCSWERAMHCDELIDQLLEEQETKTSNAADGAVPWNGN